MIISFETRQDCDIVTRYIKSVLLCSYKCCLAMTRQKNCIKILSDMQIHSLLYVFLFIQELLITFKCIFHYVSSFFPRRMILKSAVSLCSYIDLYHDSLLCTLHPEFKRVYIIINQIQMCLLPIELNARVKTNLFSNS